MKKLAGRGTHTFAWATYLHKKSHSLLTRCFHNSFVASHVKQVVSTISFCQAATTLFQQLVMLKDHAMSDLLEQYQTCKNHVRFFTYVLLECRVIWPLQCFMTSGPLMGPGQSSPSFQGKYLFHFFTLIFKLVSLSYCMLANALKMGLFKSFCYQTSGNIFKFWSSGHLAV